MPWIVYAILRLVYFSEVLSLDNLTDTEGRRIMVVGCSGSNNPHPNSLLDSHGGPIAYEETKLTSNLGNSMMTGSST